MNDTIKFDESVKVEDSENRNHWKDLVEAVKRLQGM